MLLLPLILAFIAPAVLTEDRHAVQYRSADRVFSECRQLLGHPASRPAFHPPFQCENFCAGVLSHFWNFETGGSIDPVHFARFFRQHSSVHPERYYGEFEACAEGVRGVVPEWDPCGRADRYMECLTRNATVNLDQLFYNRKTALRHQRVAEDCLGMLGISSIEAVLEGGLEKDPRGRCLIRCFLIREKLYSEANGLNPFRVLIELDALQNHRKSREDGRLCVARLQREFLDRCTLAARIAAECFEGELLEIVEQSVRELVYKQ